MSILSISAGVFIGFSVYSVCVALINACIGYIWAARYMQAIKKAQEQFNAQEPIVDQGLMAWKDKKLKNPSSH